MHKFFSLILMFAGLPFAQSQTFLLGPQEFNSDVLIHGSSAPTTVWFAPNYNTPIDYVATGGNPGGYAGFSGSWNNYWGNFVRLPQVNCTGNDTVILSMDMSHSYFASQPNDWIRFYLWDQGSSSYKNNVSSIKIDGVESIVNFGANGFGFRFNVARTWAHIEVKFYLSNVINLTNVLFYFEPNCYYNNSNTFFVQFDNIGIEAQPVQQSATVDAQSGDRSRCVGDSVSFQVVASGTPVINYQWKKDGVVLSGANGSSLVIPSVTLDTAGTYYCVVSNGLGSDSSTAAVLTVHELPQVFLGNDTLVCADTPLPLNAGAGFLSYAWSTLESSQWIFADTGGFGLGTFPFSVSVTDMYGCSGNGSINITFDACTYVETSPVAKIQVIPNPASDYLLLWNVQEKDQVILCDLQGQWMSGKREANSSSRVCIEVNTLPSGYYMLFVIKENGETERFPVIIIH